MPSYTFKRNCKVYLVSSVSGELTKYPIEVYPDLSFSQTFDEQAINVKTLHDQDAMFESAVINRANPANFEFTILVNDSSDYSIILNSLIVGNPLRNGSVEALLSSDIYVDTGVDVFKLEKAVFERGTFQLQRDALITVSVSGTAAKLSRFGPTGTVIPGTLTDVEATEYAIIPRFTDVELNGQTLTNIAGMTLELVNNVEWLNYDTLHKSLNVTGPSDTMYPEAFVVSSKMLSGNIQQYITDVNDDGLNSWDLNSSLTIKIGNTVDYLFDIEIPSVVFTNRLDTQEAFFQVYDFRMNSNSDLAAVFNHIPIAPPPPPPHPFSLYQLVFKPDTDDYWIEGTQYGTNPYQLIPSSILDSNAGWTLDAGSTVSGNVLQLAGGSGFRAHYPLENIPAGRTLTLEIEVSSMGSGDTATYAAIGNGVHGFPIIKYLTLGTNTATVTLANDFNPIYVRFTNDAPGATGPTITGISVLEKAGPYRLPGYTFTRSGEQGATNYLYGAELVTEPEFNSATGYTLVGAATISDGKGIIPKDAGAGNQISFSLSSGQQGKRFRVVLVLSSNSYTDGSFRIATGQPGNGGQDGIKNIPPTLIGTFIHEFTVSHVNTPTINLFGLDGTNTGTVEIESLSVQEIIPGSGYGDELLPATVAANYTAEDATLSDQAGRLRVTNIVNYGAAYKSFATTVGKQYHITGRTYVGTAGTVSISVGWGVHQVNSFILQPTVDTVLNHIFTAQDATSVITLKADSGAAGAYAEFEDISLVEILPAVEWFPTNVPAINDQGYHAYGALENRLVAGQDFTNSAWWGGPVMLMSANAALAPDGTMTMDRLFEAAGYTIPSRFQYVTHSAGTHTSSIFLKADGRRYAFIRLHVSSANTAQILFDLQTGTMLGITDNSPSMSNISGYIVPVGNGIYRCVVTFSVAGVTGIYHCINLSDSATPTYDGNGDYSYLGDGSSGVFAWQFQTLNGNFPDGGPLIRTAGTTASIGASLLSANINPITTDEDFVFYVIANMRTPHQSGVKRDTLAILGVPGNGIILSRHWDAGADLTIWQSASLEQRTGIPVTDTGRIGILYRRRAGRDTAAVLVNGVVTVLAESAPTAFPASLASNLQLYYDVANRPDAAIEGVFVKRGTFSDADITEILEDV